MDRVATAAGVSVSKGRRYRLREIRGHPLADRAGKVWEHRLVLYEAIGPGAHPCHWCGITVRWEATRGDADCLTVDHINGLGDDNRLVNLTPSCPTCNSARASQARATALVAAGWWSNHDTIARLKNQGRRPKIAS